MITPGPPFAKDPDTPEGKRYNAHPAPAGGVHPHALDGTGLSRDGISMRFLLESIARRRRVPAEALFPESAFRDAEAEASRFRAALESARAVYGSLRDRPEHAEFVHPDWTRNIRDIERYFVHGFGTDFLENPVINGTMVFTDRTAHEAEWQAVCAWRSPDRLARAAAGGLSAPLIAGRLRRMTAINSVHHLHHLVRFENFSGLRIEDTRSVLEFGGGYGNLARIFHNLATGVRCTIIDLPLFSCIQYVFLCATVGPDRVRLAGDGRTGGEEASVTLVPLPLMDKIEGSFDLFVSTWALSESTPHAYAYTKERDWFGADGILLAFNRCWISWENGEAEKSLELSGRRVNVEPIPFLPGSCYLFAETRR